VPLRESRKPHATQVAQVKKLSQSRTQEFDALDSGHDGHDSGTSNPSFILVTFLGRAEATAPLRDERCDLLRSQIGTLFRDDCEAETSGLSGFRIFRFHALARHPSCRRKSGVISNRRLPGRVARSSKSGDLLRRRRPSSSQATRPAHTEPAG
jgi:hypothetical protein